MKSDEPIAIIGIGCRYPGGGHGPAAFWRMLCDGVDAISEIPPDRWNLAAFYDADPDAPGKTNSRWGGFLPAIDQFDAGFFGISPREAALMDPQQRLLLETAWESLEDAGFVTDPVQGTDTGVFVGISTSDYSQIQASFTDKTSITPHTTTGGVLSIAANRISYLFNLHGPSFVVDTACSSSLVAVHLACQSLRRGECRYALAGGVNAIVIPDTFVGFSRMGMLSPDGRCKAFDARGNGFVRGEGAGVLVLKPLTAAQAEGDRIYAVIRGSAVNQDGRTGSLTVPGRAAQERLIRSACHEAGVRPEDIAYIEAHGTGTAVGDPIEAAAIGAVLGTDPTRKECLVGSVKTNIGHLEAGSGLAGIIKTALVLHHGEVPPNLHFEHPNPDIDFAGWKLRVPVARELLPRPDALGGVNSFGFGGTNAHVILQGFAPEDPPAPSDSRPAGLFLLSDRTADGLRTLAAQYAEWLPGTDEPLDAVCHTLAARRRHHAHRLAIAAGSRDAVTEKLRAFLAGESRPGLTSAVAADPGSVVFVCTGQGPQWWAMGRELLAVHAGFRDTIRECDALFQSWGDWSLHEELTRDEGSSRMNQPAIAQPAIFALQVGLARWWREHGVEPAAIIGHSVGEAAAAHLSGALDLPTAARVIFERGRCMQFAPATGRMLAAALPPESAAPWLAEWAGRVEVGAWNSPGSMTLSGDAAALEAIAAGLEKAGHWHRFLRVPYAFHSAQMDPVRDPLLAALAGVKSQPARIPLCSTVTGTLCPGEGLGAEYWWQNVRRPVRFAQGVKTLIENGFSTFVEIGPHPALSGPVLECLRAAGTDGFVTASLRRSEPEEETLLGSLGALHVRGLPVRRPGGGRHANLPLHPWRHERHWHENRESAASRLGPPGHPLLGRSRGASEPLWECRIAPGSPPYLNDHQLNGRVVFPAAGYVEMALAAAHELHGDGPLEVGDFAFSRALFLPTEGTTTVEFRSLPESGDFQIAARGEAASQWTLHASGKILRAATRHPAPKPVNLADLRAACPEEQSGATCYERFARNGFDFGNAFRGITRVFRRDGEAVGEIRMPLDAVTGGYIFHPAALDSCFQVLLSTLTPDQTGHGLFLPVRLGRLRVFARPDGPVWSHVRLRAADATALTADIRVLDQNGRVLALLEDFQCAALDSPAGQNRTADRDFYETSWRETEPDSQVERESHPRLVCGPAPLAPEIVAHGKVDGGRWEWVRPEDLPGRLSAENPPWHLVLVLPPEGSADSTTAESLCRDLLAVVQHPSTSSLARLSLVVSGGLKAPISPPQAAAVGLARVVMNERPALNCRVIDAGPSPEFKALVRELCLAGEEEVVLREGKHWVPRLARAVPPPRRTAGNHTPFRLEITKPGALDNVDFVPLARRPPGPGEVEIAVEAAGVNFRDVMKVLGIYPIEHAGDHLLGDECAGRITAVGPDVSGFRVGDAVAAISPGCFSAFLTVPAAFVVQKPDTLSPAGAATIPVTFLTAQYALHHLARLREGERVLIHAAAGGVGLAALQLARQAGAEIFATAGNDHKRDLVRSLGAAHVMDSRSLDFAEEIREITGGRGVDVVLNSLSGEALSRSLAVLTPYGRFLEIGKRDIYQNSRLGLRPFSRNLSFFAIDLSQLLRDRPAFVSEMLGELMQRFANGQLQPLLHTIYPLTAAPDAFREMAQGKHTGKILLSVEPAAVRVRAAADTRLTLRPDATYLVTGGTRGFGRAIAEWMLERGARNLVLIGSRPETARTAEDELAAALPAGVTVRTAAVDVSDPSALGEFLAALAADLPPLRGLVHAANTMDDGMLGDLTPGRLRTVFGPKAAGAWNLHRLTQSLPLDFFVMTSSVSSLVGNPGQGNYAAANAYLDALAHFRHAQGLPALAINWGHLGDVGYAARHAAVNTHLTRYGVDALPVREALAMLERLMLSDTPSVAAMRMDWERWAAANPRFKKSPRFADLTPGQDGTDPASPSGDRTLAERVRDLPASARRAALEAFVRETAARVLGLAPGSLDATRPLNEFGLDSLMGIELVNRLEDGFGQAFPTQKIVGGPSISLLTTLLEETLPAPQPDPVVAPPPDAVAPPTPAPNPAVATPSEPEPAGKEAASMPGETAPQPRHLLAHALYRLGTGLVRGLPLPVVFLLGKVLGTLGYFFLENRRRLAVTNLQMALGRSTPEARVLARRHFSLLGANVLSILKISSLPESRLRRHVTLEVSPQAADLPAGTGFVAVLSHMGNWELAGRMAEFFPERRFGAIYQPLANPLVNQDFQARRARFGTTLFSRREGYWKPLDFLKSGGVLGVLADQNAGETGTPLPFFGHPASTSTLAASLAQRAGVHLVPVSLRTVGLARWKVTIGDPLPAHHDVQAATAAINRELERQIRMDPADWLWSHNRWKLTRY